jgi:hypothetical protein
MYNAGEGEGAEDYLELGTRRTNSPGEMMIAIPPRPRKQHRRLISISDANDRVKWYFCPAQPFTFTRNHRKHVRFGMIWII